MINIDAHNHVKGKSIYLDDIQELKDTLYALPFDAKVAHAKIVSIDFEQALKFHGVVTILTAKDVPGENQIGGIIPDEPLFAENEVHFRGQVIALIIGTSEHHCRQASKQIKVVYDELPIITDAREAQKQNKLIVPPRSFKLGDTSETWSKCEHIVEGKTDVNGQEHLYIETQGAFARPKEDGSIIISSSTQGPTAVQKMVARVLGISMHKVEIDTVRLGGGFGGKEDQATPWAVMVALATHLLQKPVKMAMHRMDDMRMTGKRHPYSADFKIGLSKDLKILAYEVTHYQNAGAAADLSPAVMERTLFHSTNAYFIPNVIAKAYSCKTNLPPNTAFRGFGGPQGKFVIEAAIVKTVIRTNSRTNRSCKYMGNLYEKL
jgi:xanthine dehydrogenase large subunit